MYPANRNSGCSGLEAHEHRGEHRCRDRELANLAQPSGRQQAFRTAPGPRRHQSRRQKCVRHDADQSTQQGGDSAVGTKPDPDHRGERQAGCQLREQYVADGFHAPGSGNKKATWPCAVRGVFTLQRKPQRRPKPGGIIEGGPLAYNRKESKKPLFLCAFTCAGRTARVPAATRRMQPARNCGRKPGRSPRRSQPQAPRSGSGEN